MESFELFMLKVLTTSTLGDELQTVSLSLWMPWVGVDRWWSSSSHLRTKLYSLLPNLAPPVEFQAASLSNHLWNRDYNTTDPKLSLDGRHMKRLTMFLTPSACTNVTEAGIPFEVTGEQHQMSWATALRTILHRRWQLGILSSTMTSLVETYLLIINIWYYEV